MDITIKAQVKVYLYTQDRTDKSTGLQEITFVDVYGTKEEALKNLNTMQYHGHKDGELFDDGEWQVVQFHSEGEEDGCHYWMLQIEFQSGTRTYVERYIVKEKTF